MVGEYTGKDYAEAASHKIDWATADHMRRAMFTALKAWNDLPENERTAANGRKLWVDAPLHDEVLAKAGTAEIVSKYFKDVTDKVSDADMVAGLKSISKKDIESIDAGLKNNETTATLKAASKFSDVGKKYLHIETLTDSYQNFLKTHKEDFANISINPKSFTDEEIKNISKDQKWFNTLDGMDNALSKVGLGSPGVADKNADFNADKEHLIKQVLSSVSQLQSNDIATIKKGYASLHELSPKTDISNLGTEQAKLVADKLTHAVMDLRTSSYDTEVNHNAIDMAISSSVALGKGFTESSKKVHERMIVPEAINHAQLPNSEGGNLVTHKELQEIIKAMEKAGIKHSEKLSADGIETLTATYSDKSTTEYKFKIEQKNGR